MKTKIHILIATAMCLFGLSGQAQNPTLAVLKYNGGGDWYANPTSVTNLIAFCNKRFHMNLDPNYAVVDAGSSEVFQFPFLHMTGHGNVVFSDQERTNLRTYLEGGGFLHIDDNYGMDPYVRPEIQKLFPEHELIDIPTSHPLFQKPYAFPNGLPKVHEHDNNAPQALGIFIEGRLALLYTFEADLGDGWEDLDVHNDPEEVHLRALEMGANLIHYVFTGNDTP